MARIIVIISLAEFTSVRILNFLFVDRLDITHSKRFCRSERTAFRRVYVSLSLTDNILRDYRRYASFPFYYRLRFSRMKNIIGQGMEEYSTKLTILLKLRKNIGSVGHKKEARWTLNMVLQKIHHYSSVFDQKFLILLLQWIRSCLLCKLNISLILFVFLCGTRCFEYRCVKYEY